MRKYLKLRELPIIVRLTVEIILRLMVCLVLCLCFGIYEALRFFLDDFFNLLDVLFEHLNQ
jgi:hypothetical protein